MAIQGWAMRQAGQPLEEITVEADLSAGQAVVKVAGCGVCHTDLGYLFDGVPLRGTAPVILGHEVAGVVEDAAGDCKEWIGKSVIIPAVIPCGSCDACGRGKSGICPKQTFIGNDLHGGFASHVVVPARGLCEVPDSLTSRLDELSVIADAVTTPLNAVVRSELGDGDLAVFVGVGGIGAFGVQIAKAYGSHVVALDVDDDKLAVVESHGADAVLNIKDVSSKDLKKQLRAMAKENGWPRAEWRIFETSGTTAGQSTAFSLLNFGATLMVVGYIADETPVRLSNLMAFEARALGVWGCPLDLYPRAVELVDNGDVVIEPFIERHPMSEVNEVMHQLHNRRIGRRVVLTPDFQA